jgi:hypothetical protein
MNIVYYQQGLKSLYHSPDLTWKWMTLKQPSLKDNSMNIHVVYIQTFQWFLGIYMLGFFFTYFNNESYLEFLICIKKK